MSELNIDANICVLVKKALEKNKLKKDAAKQLGINIKRLRSYIKKYKL